MRVGILVTGNTYRHPVVLANMAAMVDQITHVRFDFGIGAGWNELERAVYGMPLYPPGERIRHLNEACEVTWRLGAEPVATFEGK